jgi:predicted 3-demethylubiquinone-9 3-methyltransferase (glyoxalase superfamily)
MQKIIPHLWFDHEAQQAVEFYLSAFGEESKITGRTILPNTPSGDTEVLSFLLAGYEFMAINAGPLVQFNPSISFHVYGRTREEVDLLWNRLGEGGTPLMNLDSYPFNERFGWLQDRYGLSWQIMLNKEADIQKIVPALMFTGDMYGKAEEAIRFYVSIFGNTRIHNITRYQRGEDPDVEGAVKQSTFELEGQTFVAMESAYEHGFSFNESISLMVYCENQEEIDYYWDRLSAVPEAEECGWLKDQYGLSWQIVPRQMNDLMYSSDEEKRNQLVQGMLKMKKWDITKLENA